ncbi:acetyl coenzyme A carboxylase alpha [Capsaspora owczarzaki ATCC 30864]|uniref:Acetyl coenzyme A carboxylase alpha n=2 Tax=Capsaspora owczarzaki (strain ATCC 30864) TaxID=595528 RepID=A0A0D2WVM9_CAPO3|nr:acetyl coenzyme A carboxylase alpha [Capsaspora owczarzaki ATCC 30864]
MRRWLYETFGNDHVIKFLVMATPEDIKANAEYIKMADQYIPVPGGTNNNNYANVELIVEIAERHGVHAVWAGWGHASENPKLPDALDRLGIAFIGPPGSAMRALGDKISSSIVAQSADVSTLPWSGSGLTIPCLTEEQMRAGHHLTVPHDIYLKGCVQDVSDGQISAKRIGYPIMIKAAEGGGGKGIRRVEHADDFAQLFRQVQSEVPGSPIFLMKLATKARHLEVQLLGDKYGQCVSLFGRDCSVQRRHQKIIEEGPATIAKPDVFTEMERAAVRLARLVGYVSTGTVEYLYTPEDESYTFLELNPRLQVEHPCTEMIADVNLPAAQLQIAMGIPLHNIKDIRLLYQQDPASQAPIDFANVSPHPPNGHVIACRITAENPDEGFKPSSGLIKELNFRSSKNVWGYFSVSASGGLHEFADSQFGHLFAWGENREEARRHMVGALKDISIRGDFRTTVEFLLKLIETDNFRGNSFDTSWLDSLIKSKVTAERPDTLLAVICGTVHIADAFFQERIDSYRRSLERGQILSRDFLKNSTIVDIIYDNVKYQIEAVRSGPNAYVLGTNGSYAEVDMHRLSDGGTLVLFGGHSHVTYMKEEKSRYRVTVDSKTCVFEKENDPSFLRTSSPGKMIRHLIPEGEHVNPGQPFAEIEVMKMILPLISNEAGLLHHLKLPGTVLEAGDVVATLTLDDPSRVQRARPFEGTLPASQDLQIRSEKIHHTFRRVKTALENNLAGFNYPDSIFSARLNLHIREYFNALQDPRLPLFELQEVLAALSGRIPARIEELINGLLIQYTNSLNSMFCAFPTQQIASVIDMHAASLSSDADRTTFFTVVEPIIQHIQHYRNGIRGHSKAAVASLLRAYLEVETVFNIDKPYEDIVYLLKEQHRTDVNAVVRMVMSHHHVESKNTLILSILKNLSHREGSFTADDRSLLSALATLNKKENSKVALFARQILIQSQLPSFNRRRLDVEVFFQSAVESIGEQCAQKLQELVDTGSSIFDVLVTFFYHNNLAIQLAALEVYVRRSYTAYLIQSIRHEPIDSGRRHLVMWRFILPSSHPSLQSVVQRQRSNSNPSRPQLRKTISTGEGIGLRADDTSSEISIARTGIMGAFDTVADFEQHIDEILQRFPRRTNPLTTSGYQRASFTSLPQLSSQHPPTQVIESGLTPSPSLQSLDTMNAAYVAAAGSAPPSPFFMSPSGAVMSMDNTGHASGTSTPTSSALAGATSVNAASASAAPALAEALKDEPANILNIAIKPPNGMDDAEQDPLLIESFQEALQSRVEQLHECDIRRVTFLVLRKDGYPRFFTFRASSNFKEDSIYRHIEPALAFQLELFKLSNYRIKLCPASNNRLHFYYSEGKVQAGQPVADRRFFVRVIIRHADLISSNTSLDYFFSEGERQMIEALDEIELNMSNPAFGLTDCNHIFMNFAPVVLLDPLALVEPLRDLVIRHGKRLWKLRVMQAEIKMNVRRHSGSPVSPVRYFVHNHTGFCLTIHAYREVEDPRTGKMIFETVGARAGPLHGHEVSAPYLTKDHLQLKRYAAQSSGSTYVYDLPELFREALWQIWQQHSQKMATVSQRVDIPDPLLNMTELILDENDNLIAVNRPPGSNKIGMVAWRLEVFTPECPDGREIILISNDITHQIGSFGLREDTLFKRASELARSLGLPRIYVSANSGARIGLAEEVKKCFRAAWISDAHPAKGFRYLYVTPDDYKQLSTTQSVNAELIEENGESRYRLLDIIGAQDGLGVENLRGSGMIAGETSLAFDETYTLTIVSCRSVGIGAYLVRLGQRTIQVESSHIILTGANALNKVLGREVYTSNQQLGGTQIMYCNGVSHVAVADDFAAVHSGLSLLSYVPRRKGAPLPVMRAIDPVDRMIDYVPPKAPYDPRWMLAGRHEPTDPSTPAASNVVQGGHRRNNSLGSSSSINPSNSSSPQASPMPFTPLTPAHLQSSQSSTSNAASGHSSQSHSPAMSLSTPFSAPPLNLGKWQSGFFDHDSFIETMGGWAQTVVTGRARLGGIPVGVIAVETRTVELLIPADPANPDSESQVIQQAGQVWFPNSAYKTAQAIKDCDREELPLFVFANWRGFSGGARDMMDQVLKFGAYIVDALREYKQPVLVYIPPNGELRGGAWVVVDPTINLDMMEMYADETSRGGVLEPEGTVEIKYRRRDLILTMERLDSLYADLSAQLKAVDGKLAVETGKLQKQLQRLQQLHASQQPLTHQGMMPQALATSQSLEQPTKSEEHLQLEAERATLAQRMATREAELLPVYHQVAITFADLHDTPGRMKAKGTISEVLQWRSARKFLYWRLRRRIAEETLRKKIMQANGELTVGQAVSVMRRWLVEAKGAVGLTYWDDNRAMAEWFETSQQEVSHNIQMMRQAYVVEKVRKLSDEGQDVALTSIFHLIHVLSPAQREDVVKMLLNANAGASTGSASDSSSAVSPGDV